MPPQLTQFYYV
jgi:hypothetical protein